jgi:adenylylsulfate kinase
VGDETVGDESLGGGAAGVGSGAGHGPPPRVPVLVVTGPVGVGKTTVASAVGDGLRGRGLSHTVVDVDWLGQSWPAPVGDPFNSRLVYRNLADVARNALAAGSDRLVLAYVVEDRAGREALAACVPGADLVVVRLTAGPGTNEARLRGRETAESLAWYLARAPELEGIMATNGVGDHVVATDGRTPAEVAAEVLRVIGW